MKKNIKSIALVAFLVAIGYEGMAQTTAQKIGANPTIKDPSALLELEAANRGFLMPRVALTSLTDVSTIANPAHALTVFNTATTTTGTNDVTPGYYYYNKDIIVPANSKWVRLVDANTPTTAWNLLGNTGTLETINFLGTIDNVDLKFRVHNQQVAWFGSETQGIQGSIFLGQNAGLDALGNHVTEPAYSYFIGTNAGYLTRKPYEVNAFGHQAGEGSTGSLSNFMGARAGLNANAGSSNFLGYEAGSEAKTAGNSNFIGAGAGKNSTNAAKSIFIGNNTGSGDVMSATHVSSGSSAILIGNDAHTGGFSNAIALGTGATNTAANQFMIGSTALGGTLYDIVNPKYPQTRNDASVTTPINFLYTDANGKVLSAPLTAMSAIATKTANYTMLIADETILVDAMSGLVQITLPAASANKGKKYNVKKIDASANGAQVISAGGTIDGNAAGTGVTGTLPWQGWVFQSDGTNWFIISRI